MSKFGKIIKIPYIHSVYVRTCVCGKGHLHVEAALYASERQYEYCTWTDFAFCFICHKKEQVFKELSSTRNTACSAVWKYIIKISSLKLLCYDKV